MNNQKKTPTQIFFEMIVAGMSDAAAERKMTQLLTEIDPDGKGLRKVRIIIVPEKMDQEWTKPLGT